MSSPEAAFWRWFQANEQDLLAVVTAQEPVCDALLEEMQRVHPDLTFEFGPVLDDGREFVVSAGGIKEAFPAVERLTAAAPPLPRWTVIPFRPGREGMQRLQLGPVTLVAAEVLVRAEPDDEKVGITLALPGFRPTSQQLWEQAGFLLLDALLGEYLVETRIGFIEFEEASARSPGEWVPLPAFAAGMRRPAAAAG